MYFSALRPLKLMIFRSIKSNKGGEMTQSLYAHINNKRKKKRSKARGHI
jgi:hypothetical protein